MIQDQLVDYVSSQIKLGVSRDAIKSALVSAGWVAADIEDTLKKVEANTSAQPSAPAVKPASSVSAVGAGAQTIRVSDLISVSPAMNASAGSSSMPNANSTKPMQSQASMTRSQSTSNDYAAPSSGMLGGKKMLIMEIVGGLVLLGLAGAAWYFYSGNSDLSAQVASLTAENTKVKSDLVSLQTQNTTASNGLSTQVASLTAANKNLALDLSFYVAVPGGATSSPVMVKGVLGTEKGLYTITNSDNVKLLVMNSVDNKVAAMLKPLLGQQVSLDGSYTPGTVSMMATLINGNDPHAVPTSTATSTPAATPPPSTSTSTPAPANASSTSK